MPMIPSMQRHLSYLCLCVYVSGAWLARLGSETLHLQKVRCVIGSHFAALPHWQFYRTNCINFIYANISTTYLLVCIMNKWEKVLFWKLFWGAGVYSFVFVRQYTFWHISLNFCYISVVLLLTSWSVAILQWMPSPNIRIYPFSGYY